MKGLRLIPCGGSYECESAATTFDYNAEAAIYGGGPLQPGFNFHKLLHAWHMNQLVAVAGVTITDECVTWRAEVREQIGEIFRALNVPFYVVDDLSLEWTAHFGLSGIARLGPRLCWREPAELQAHVVCMDTVGGAIQSICDGCVPVLRLPTRTQLTEQFCELYRFVQQYDLHNLLAHGLEEVTSIAARVEADFAPYRSRLRDLAQREAAAVAEFLATLQPSKVSNVDAVKELVSVSPLKTSGRRRLEIGSVFDPSTHYTEDYYEGNAGIEYWKGGKWELYHGTTCEHWAGNEILAQFLHHSLTDRHVVDLGCSAGDFLLCAKELGNARSIRGLELSDAAFKFAHETVRPHLTLRNIVDDPLESKADVISAWDVWEHIYYGDVDTLMEAVRLNLHKGGLHFAKICCRMLTEKSWEIQPGDLVTEENSWLLVSGHVLIKSWSWWAQKFAEHGLAADWQVTTAFNVRAAEHPIFSQDKSWSPKNFFALRAV